MGVEKTAVLKAGMDERPKEFIQGGSEIYTPE
jgi:hypothetical protein